MAALIAIAWPRGPKEPEYEGKKLSEWLRDGIEKTNDKPAEVVRHMGKEAVPYLAKWISIDVPRWQQWYWEKFRAYPMAPFVSQIERKFELYQRATDAFMILGPVGKPAIPRLMDIAKRGGFLARRAALDCLGYIGCDAVPQLVELANDGNISAARHLTELHRDKQCDVATAVPAMLLLDHRTRLRETPNGEDFFYCARSFSDDPTYFSPLIRDCLKHPNVEVRTEATNVLEILEPVHRN